MSRYFVSDQAVPIPEFEAGTVLDDDGQPRRPNVIYIRPKMNYKTEAAVNAAALRIDTSGASEMHPEDYLVALLVQNIVRWEGPDFDGVPCTPSNIENLDPDEPHIERVCDEIARRNKKKESPNPKSPPTANGSMSGGGHGSPRSQDAAESLSLQLATGTSRSPLRSALDGHLNKSENLTRTT
jgi:hypothetical protein